MVAAEAALKVWNAQPKKVAELVVTNARRWRSRSSDEGRWMVRMLS